MRARHIVLLICLLAAARAHAQPAPLPILDVPFVSQSEVLCGGAAAAMVLRFWGERGVSAETFVSLVDRSAAGIRTTTLVNDLNRRGWLATVGEATSQAISRELASGRPPIVLIEDRPGTFHYIVIVGATDRVIVFHDPARAPLRVIAREEFERRSRAAGRWMAIVVPGLRSEPDPGPPAAVLPEASTPCDERVRSGIASAQAGDLEAAERSLTGALSCPGSSVLRELAGVRLLQRRWEDVEQLSSQAVRIDPADSFAWKLLGTSRFVLNDPAGALDAWNHAGEPRLDLVRVQGLEHTRQRPVERMLGLVEGQVMSAEAFRRAGRAIRDLPSARSAQLELVPAGQGLVEIHATLVERSPFPHDRWSWVMTGARAAIARTAGLTLGSLSGGGESLSLEWRFWEGRPRVAASWRAPAPWPGTWGADLFVERQEFTSSGQALQRRGGRFTGSRWMMSRLRLDVRAGAERWNTTSTLGTGGASATLLTTAEHVRGDIAVDGWTGASTFGSVAAGVSASSARNATSGSVPLGVVGTASAGIAAVTTRTPLDLWPAGDTGQVRPILARAHPVLDDGQVRLERIGRRAVYGSAEAQYWWKAPALTRVGVVAFTDVLRTMTRLVPGGAIGDVDVGVGFGLTSLLVPGRIRVDLAHGLRDGADAVSVRYVVTGW